MEAGTSGLRANARKHPHGVGVGGGLVLGPLDDRALDRARQLGSPIGVEPSEIGEQPRGLDAWMIGAREVPRRTGLPESFGAVQLGRRAPQPSRERGRRAEVAELGEEDRGAAPEMLVAGLADVLVESVGGGWIRELFQEPEDLVGPKPAHLGRRRGYGALEGLYETPPAEGGRELTQQRRLCVALRISQTRHQITERALLCRRERRQGRQGRQRRERGRLLRDCEWSRRAAADLHGRRAGGDRSRGARHERPARRMDE